MKRETDKNGLLAKNKYKMVAYNNRFTFVSSKQEAIEVLKSKGLAFGWYNGQFISVE